MGQIGLNWNVAEFFCQVHVQCGWSYVHVEVLSNSTNCSKNI